MRATVGVSRTLTWVCLLIGLGQAWILFSPAPRLIVWKDSVSYLAPAASALAGGPFTHAGGRSFGYPGWLWLVLSFDDSPLALVTAQRVLVLITYGCLATAVVIMLRQDRVREWLGHTASAALAMVWLLTFVLYPPAAGLAHIVMPEVLFGCLLSVITLALVAHAAPSIDSRLAGIGTAVLVMASIMLTVVKPHGWLSAAGLLIGVTFLAPGPRRRRSFVIAAVAVVVGGLLLIVPELRLRSTYDAYTSKVFGPRSLFCNSADLVQPYLQAHVERPVDAAAAEALSRLLTPQARAAATDWRLLGFDGDACMYGEGGRIVQSSFTGDGGAEAGYYLGTYSRALLAQPTYLPRRLLNHAAEFAAKPYNAVAGEYFLRASPENVVGSQEPLLATWLATEPQLFAGLVELPTRPIMWPLRVFFVLAGAALVVMTVLAVAALATGSSSVAAGTRSTFLGVLMAAVGINVLVATVHTFEPRYLAMQTPLWAATGFSASLIVASAARHVRGLA
jgi:hypothetical protein